MLGPGSRCSLALLTVVAALVLAGCGSQRPASVAHARSPQPVGPGVPTGCTPIARLYTEGIQASSKVVALTFDDGPSGYTRQVLDILERQHVHATFFVIGNQVRDHSDQVRRALRDGNFIANHTYTHPDLLRTPPTRARSELQGAQQAIWQATAFTPCFWRAPYGSVNPGLLKLARGLGMVSIQWDTDPQDFNSPPAATIYHRVLYGNPKDPDPGVHPGAIVLLHDGGGNRAHTVQALPGIIDALRRQGYRFLTVPELLGIKPTYSRPRA